MWYQRARSGEFFSKSYTSFKARHLGNYWFSRYDIWSKKRFFYHRFVIGHDVFWCFFLLQLKSCKLEFITQLWNWIQGSCLNFWLCILISSELIACPIKTVFIFGFIKFCYNLEATKVFYSKSDHFTRMNLTIPIRITWGSTWKVKIDRWYFWHYWLDRTIFTWFFFLKIGLERAQYGCYKPFCWRKKMFY